MKKLKTKVNKSMVEVAASIRGSWNGVNPVTRIMQSKKNYDRNSNKQLCCY